MHDVSGNSFKTYVREQELDITPDLLIQVLEIDRVEGAHFPIVNNRQINYNLVAKELTGKPVAWVGGDIAHHKLTESYCLLNIFICHNVSPKLAKESQKRIGISFTASGLKGESIFLSRCFVEWPRSHITSVELDDDGEGDIAGPSGAGPSGVGPSVVTDLDAGMSGDDQIGEVAINALNECI
ncbi:hypothetical protein MRB53_010043 [Persea americana]|uniref:Uncharacterized protein n=1 Tax=Persea americana TaxID=3435 RepID=A0ACC2LQT8_PERAE|nr:hypothetical protein MRB53_010043 [Persea americana]